MRAREALYKPVDVSNQWHTVVAGLCMPTAVIRFQEIWAICTRAQAAAHHYEAHRSLSDQALAARGLIRTDLPRAAFRELTGSSKDWS
jgi:hypothetical protein